jgi:plastocyanin
MRATWLTAGAVVLVAACGGGAKPAQDSTAATAAAAPAATGTTHDVQMAQVGADYRFVPAELTIKSGDMVKFTNMANMAHNVQFFADSIPAGSAAMLDANMPNRMGPLASNLMTAQGETYTISFAGAPAGVYKFNCLPHSATGMHGQITVTQ